MLERIHANSDILTNGKIMLLVDCEPGCYTLTDLEYSEHALQELLVDTHKAIQEAISTKNNFSFETHVTILVSLTNNIKNITESLLTIKVAIQAAKSERGAIISESYQKERVSILQNCQIMR